jgi:DNA-binding LytR/AlgR family response regulator
MRVLIVDDERPAHQIRKRHFPSPSIVFVTAHVEHAVAAFEKHTVDYVLKPFSNESISEALVRGLSESKGRASREIDRSFAAVAEAVSSAVLQDSNQS